MEVGKENIAKKTSPTLEVEDGDFEMEIKPWKLETIDNETILISFKSKEIRQDQEKEFIDFIDECKTEIEKKAGLRRIQKGEVIKLLGLGVVLPTIDVWTDVYLAVKLHLAGHEGWAQATLCPGYLNTCFCFIAWFKNEKPVNVLALKNLNGNPINFQAFKTLPFVFLQFYPQFCVLKVIVNGCRYKEWIPDLEEYEASAAHLEGVVESTPTVFIQSVIVGSLLAYQTTEILLQSERNCELQCSNSSGLLDLASCNAMSECISACVTEFLSLDSPNQHWLLSSNITRHDVLNTQAYHYFVGEQTTFILIYLISIGAASLSFANFIKSGFVRYTQEYLSRRFLFSILTVLLSFGLKIYSLITFVTMDRTGLTNWIRKDEKTEGRSVVVEGSYWLLIFVLPNLIFAMVSLIASREVTCERIKLAFKTFTNAPAILMIPALGTITFRFTFVKADTLNKAELKLFAVNKEQHVMVPRVSITLSLVNAAISILITAVTGVGKMDQKKELVVIVGVVFILLFGCGWLMTMMEPGNQNYETRKGGILRGR
eukprot:GFUD01012833.1.p1 GENE.GFUD01012833.1~~GFUD01012833.1.p1  ORF type:complete len:543 (-),score=72.59 GFUD01012833.1:141-1769(-)